MRISDNAHERNEFIFITTKCTKKTANNKKRWCIQTPPCYWIYNQNVCNVVRCNGFFSSCSFHFCSHYYYRQSASLIYSDLCLVVHFIYAFFALFFSTEQKKKNKKQNPRKEKNFAYSSFICNLIPWSQAIGMCIHYSYA